jgi:hypothetical protein
MDRSAGQYLLRYLPFLCAAVLLMAVLGTCADSLSTWVLAETERESHGGRGLFLVDAGSFAGNSTYFYVEDPATNSRRPLFVGGPYASDGSIKFRQAIWSRDGTILAVRVEMGTSSGHGFSGRPTPYLLDAYDFRAHAVVSRSTDATVRSAEIRHALNARGGDGEIAMESPSMAGRSIGTIAAARFDRSKSYTVRAP